MKILIHHIYEYKKGLRNLVLHTMRADLSKSVEKKLICNNIPYLIRKVNENKINIFFGAKECIDVMVKIGNKPLNKLSDEEDFILGIMLGYNRLAQCKRFIKRMNKKQKNIMQDKKDIKINSYALN